MSSKKTTANNGSSPKSLEPTNLNGLKPCCYNNLHKKLFATLCVFVLSISVFGYVLFGQFYIHEANIWCSVRKISEQVNTLNSRIDKLVKNMEKLKDLPAQFEIIRVQTNELAKIIISKNVTKHLNADAQQYTNEVTQLKKDILKLSEKITKLSEVSQKEHNLKKIDVSKDNKTWQERLKDLFKEGFVITKFSK